MSARSRPRHRRSRVATLAVVLLLSSCAIDEGGDAAIAPEAGPITVSGGSAESAPVPAAEAQRVGAVEPEEPRRVVLPGGRAVGIRPVSTTANGVLDVPSDIRSAGWWRGGSRLGDPFGSTLVAAHVDSRAQGLGPFARLLTVRRGDRILLRSQTLDQTYVVRSLRLRPQGSIESGSALHSPGGARRLTLVTCAGPFDADRGGYQNLAVVVAVPAGPPRPRTDR